MNNYIYCPMCGEKVESWSGFHPDRVFQIRRSTIRCSDCGFDCEVVVNVGDGSIPKVNFEMRDNE
jgi:transcription elongation factor Elf1